MPPVLTNEDKKKALSLAKRLETCLIVLGCKIDCSCFHDNICEKYITQRLGWLCLLKANFHLFIDLILIKAFQLTCPQNRHPVLRLYFD